MKRALAFALSFLAVTAAQAAALVLAGGTVVDGYGNAPIQDGIVVIENDRILAVGGAGQVAIPEGAEVISTEGMTVLPGLWDMQVELMRLGHGDTTRWNETYGPLAERVVMPIAARQLLQAGVTSARDVASPLEAAVRVRGRVREKLIDGPSLFISGPALRKLAPAGTGDWQWEVSGAADARAKVQRLANAGVDYILLADVGLWTAEELEAVVAEARIRGLPVHAYAERPADIVRGAAAQFDGFLGTGIGRGGVSGGGHAGADRAAHAGRRAADRVDAGDFGAAQSRGASRERRAARRPAHDRRASRTRRHRRPRARSQASIASRLRNCPRPGRRRSAKSSGSSTKRKSCCSSARARARPGTCTPARPGRRSISG